ncbi:CAP-GLY domain-containing linker protein 1 [Globodera pallida]|nr:CAP-GLY domain-containing linker protein 1 [Globodera pallida]
MKKSPSKESLFSTCSEAQTSETFSIGDVVKVGERIGRVAFTGRTQFQPGDWAGIILDTPNGKNNGSVNDIKYFECQDRYGLFCRPGKLVKMHPNSSNVARSPIAAANSVSGARSQTNSVYSVAFSVAASQAGGSKEHSPYAAQFGYDIGDRIITDDGRAGKVKFLNIVANQIYAGIVLDRPLGDSDGKFQGIQYFKCYPKYAAFLPADQLRRAAVTAASDVLPSKKTPRPTKASQLRAEKGGCSGTLAGIGGSAIHGSRESLDSLMRSPPPALIVKSGLKQSPSGIKDSDFIASLKKCLQEKEAHLAQLSIELNERSNDADRFAQETLRLRLRVGELDAELNATKRQLAATSRTMQRGIDERDKRLEDLSFCFTEVELKKEELEHRLTELCATAMPMLFEQDGHEVLTVVADQQKTNDETFKEHCCMQDVSLQTDDIKESTPILQRPAWTQTDWQFLKMNSLGLQTEQAEMTSTDMQTESEEKPKMVTSGLQTEPEVKPEMVTSGLQTESEENPQMVTSEMQTDQTEFISSEVQTKSEEKPKMVTSGLQTDPEVKPEMITSGLQTESEENPQMVTTGVQTDQTEFISSEVQTESEEKPKMVTSGLQTDPEVKPEMITSGLQTESEENPQMVTSEMQTDQTEFISSEVQTKSEEKPKMVTSGLQTDPEVKPEMITSGLQTESEENPQMVTTGVQTDQTEFISSEVQTKSEEKPKMVNSGVQTDLVDLISSENVEIQAIRCNNSSKDGEVLELNVSKLPKDADSSLFINPGRNSPRLEESLRRRHNDEELRQTNEFQRSIIADQLAEIIRLKQLQNGVEKNGSPSAVRHSTTTFSSTTAAIGASSPVLVGGGLATVSGRARARQRTYCEHCELFDAHDSVECPKEEARQAERHQHSAISPQKRDGQGRFS